MRASIDTNSVVIDSIVLKNFGLSLPKFNETDKIENIAFVYDELQTKMNAFLKTEIAVFILRKFYKFHNIKDTDVSNLKAIDLTIWQIR